VAAYRRGIFPWYSPGQPVLWWSPDPREVLLPREFHTSRSLRRAQRLRGFEYHVDRDFAAVIAACAAPRAHSPGTWITPEMHAAYLALHERGIAHSNEIWRAGSLIGGMYGVQLGRVYFGESMFSRERDAWRLYVDGWIASYVRSKLDAEREAYPVREPDLADLEQYMWKLDAPYVRRSTSVGGIVIEVRGRSTIMLWEWLDAHLSAAAAKP